METPEIKSNLTNAAHVAMAEHHEQLAKKYEGVAPNSIVTDSDTDQLMPFNGYYGLEIDGVSGAFFTVDTNMHMALNATTPIYDISLIVCLDGVNSHMFDFTTGGGTFDGSKLRLVSPAVNGGYDIEMVFTREGLGSDMGVTANISGHITLPGATKIKVTGSTYNNAIPYEQYIGTYHEEFIGIPSGHKALEIQPEYVLMYDYGNNANPATKVPSYTYNFNMYFFSITKKVDNNKDLQSSHLIMGTSSKAGLVCNDMISVAKIGEKSTSVVPRLLQTIEIGEKIATTNALNENSDALGAFSGYYPLPMLAPGAFLSIEAIYTISDEVTTSPCEVQIGLSVDGKVSKMYTFDSTMSFIDGNLSINTNSTPITSILSINFKREYVTNGLFGTLVTITGTVTGKKVEKAFTPFNPVPLKGFGGSPMTGPNQEVLTISETSNSLTWSENSVTNSVKSYKYVPIMYILVWKIDEAGVPTKGGKDSIVLSFGTDGGRGNTTIVTRYNGKIPTPPTVVTAISKDNSDMPS